jgi:hypothetical protein
VDVRAASIEGRAARADRRRPLGGRRSILPASHRGGTPAGGEIPGAASSAEPERAGATAGAKGRRPPAAGQCLWALHRRVRHRQFRQARAWLRGGPRLRVS